LTDQENKLPELSTAQLGKIVSDIAEMAHISYSTQTNSTYSELKKILADMIRFLIDHAFEKLLWILYRIDVDEEKLKKLLAEHTPDHAPDILAELIIMRERQKEKLKEEFKQHATEDQSDDALRW
jgi:hypothetical protein